MMKNYYAVLGVPRGASEREIKSAYRRIAFRCHPDHNRGEGDPEAFREATEAYHALLRGIEAPPSLCGHCQGTQKCSCLACQFRMPFMPRSRSGQCSFCLST